MVRKAGESGELLKAEPIVGFADRFHVPGKRAESRMPLKLFA